MAARKLPVRSRTGFTPELGAKIVRDVDSGLMDGDVALRAGVHRHTLQSWVRRGCEPDAPRDIQQFAYAYIVKCLELEKEHLANVMDAANPLLHEDEPDGKKPKRRADWKAAAWFLEKRFPRKYGRSVPEKGPAELIDFPMDIPDRKALTRKILTAPPPELLQELARMGFKLVPVGDEPEPED